MFYLREGSMQTVRTLKFRIYPDREQREQIDATINCCRFVYNHMLERSTKAYKRRGERMAGYDMESMLPELKARLPWLKCADSTALKCSCKQLDRAFGNFFKKKGGYPKFKRKHDATQSYTTNCVQATKYEVGRIKLLKLGWVRHSDKRNINGNVCEASVIKEQGKYYVSLVYKFELDVKPAKPINCIGLDYKSNGLYVDSNGECCEMPHFYRESLKKISKEQRILSRRQRGSKDKKPSSNYIKQLNKLQKRHKHIANQRKDFLHKKSTEIANQYDFVAVEDLNLKGIAQGLRLGKATLDNGYGMFLDMLQYKLEERGKTLAKVDRYYPSSQTCSCCGYKNPLVKNLNIREWICPECGVVHDRDTNAAVNILNEGLRMSA